MARSRSRSRSRSPRPRHSLPDGVDEIADSDYFLRNAEFRQWLKEEKGRYLDEISGEKARSYFHKFVKAWNRGKLHHDIYNAASVGSASKASEQTSYKWAFAKEGGKVDHRELNAARQAVSSATYQAESHRSGGRTMGPTMPNSSDVTFAREIDAEHTAAQRKADRKRGIERVEESLGPREVGKERMLEKKRAKRDSDREFRNAKDDAGLEIDESTLMGGGDSFKAQVARRDAAQARREAARQSEREARSTMVDARKEKERATMDMFQQMARDRFG